MGSDRSISLSCASYSCACAMGVSNKRDSPHEAIAATANTSHCALAAASVGIIEKNVPNIIKKTLAAT